MIFILFDFTCMYIYIWFITYFNLYQSFLIWIMINVLDDI
jgi:hypothetical protein